MSISNCCDICQEIISKFKKYSKFEQSFESSDVVIEKEDLNVLISYINTWPLKHCSCCYKDYKNFNRFDNLVQLIIHSSFSLIKFIINSSNEQIENVQCCFKYWNIEDKDKLLQLNPKIFQLSFPLYVAYKHSNIIKNEELSQKEIKILSNYCDISEYEMPIFLMRKIIFFIEAHGFSLFMTCFKETNPSNLPISFANSILSTIQCLKHYFNLSTINRELIFLKTYVVEYLCKMPDADLRIINNRAMFEYMWSVIKDFNIGISVIDKDVLKIAHKYFSSSTLTMRLAGLAQINTIISVYNDLNQNTINSNIEETGENLIKWIVENKIIENIFGPNSHFEVIKQSHFILAFIAPKLTNEHLDIIWNAAQLKHYERYIFELLSQLIKCLQIKHVFYLYNLLWKLNTKDHSEHTLNLASQIIKFIWFHHGIQPDMISNCSYSNNDRIFDKKVFSKNMFFLSTNDVNNKTSSSSESSLEVSDEEDELNGKNQPIFNAFPTTDLSNNDLKTSVNDMTFNSDLYKNYSDKSFLKFKKEFNDENTDKFSQSSLENIAKVSKNCFESEIKSESSESQKSIAENKVFNFHTSNVCVLGNTLLWDILQDKMLNQLNEETAKAAEKIFWNTIYCASNQEIRLKFINGCLENISKNYSVITSIRLLQKLFSSFFQYQEGKLVKHIIIDAEKHRNMLNYFFKNLSLYMSARESFIEDNNLKSKFCSHKEEIQIRLNFLSYLFIHAGSHETFSFSQSHVDILWNIFTESTYSEIVDEFFNWLSNLFKLNCLNIDIINHILFEKLPSLEPECFSLISLDFLQSLLDSVSLKNCQSLCLEIVVKLLWDIAFKNSNHDVSMNASRHLNNYYINMKCSKFEKEEEFINSCVKFLKDASILLPVDCEKSTTLIERAVILLKTHLESFYARYAFYFRSAKLSTSFFSQVHKIREFNESIFRFSVTSPFKDKASFELSVFDYVGDLRAEIQYWWNSLCKKKFSHSEENHEQDSVCLVVNDNELSFEMDERRLLEFSFKDSQLNPVSFHIKSYCKFSENTNIYLSDSFLQTFMLTNPKNLLLKSKNFDLLFILMHQLDMINISNLKARILSRNIWEIIQMIPTSQDILEKFNSILILKLEETDSFVQSLESYCEKIYQEIFPLNSNQKLVYSCQIVDYYKRINKNWPQVFIKSGGLNFLYKLLIDSIASVKVKNDWTEWKQDCFASLLQVLFQFGLFSFEKTFENFSSPLFENECKKNKRMRKGSSDKGTSILKFSAEFISTIDDKTKLIETIVSILSHVFINSRLVYQTSIWTRAQVVNFTLTFFSSWCYSDKDVFDMFFDWPNTKDVLKKLILEDIDPIVRRESCHAFNRLCTTLNREYQDKSFIPKFLNLLLSFLKEASVINVVRLSKKLNSFEDKEFYGSGNKDYFWLVCRLIDQVFAKKMSHKIEIGIEELLKTVTTSIFNRDNFEKRKNLIEDEGLKGLLELLTVLVKNFSFNNKNDCKKLIYGIFNCLFALPGQNQKEFPKCKNFQTRAAAFDLLLELVQENEENYSALANLLIDQHRHEILGRTSAYPWEYWPQDESRSDFVGLTNLGATCYMASCMQHLFMLNEARNIILTSNLSSVMKHESILRELQKMFIFLQESERKAYNPRNFCKVYNMDHQPLNICEQKDMTEFFTDLISKLEEMNFELKEMVKKHFSGLQSNNVVSLDCPHLSQTTEEFYTLRCQVAEMRDLYESLNELTVKDTLDGDNMYNCSTCGKKVRAEKRACIKKLPKILCFNTMRYTFNMITMTKEKVNTHFSFPFVLDMAPYLEKNLLNLPANSENPSNLTGKCDDTTTKYDLIGVTVHTGTAEGGHYYSFIQDRNPSSLTRNKWFLFNDAEVKLFDKSQIATECFGGEITSKTYDQANDKYLDFSFEKTNSAYMLFYEKSEEIIDYSLVGISSTEISKELLDWIWNDNISFIRDKLIFEHAYFDFIWKICSQIPQKLHHSCSNNSVLISTRLAALFVLETLIHAKEKPTLANWIEFLTKQFNNSQKACEWFMNYLSENDWWSVQILFKCSNQMVRQLFVRLCIHIIGKLKPCHFYLPISNNSSKLISSQGIYTCVTKFICRLISLVNVDMISVKPNIKYLTEYFSFLLEFAKQGDEECRFLLSIDTISITINFYTSYGKISSDFSETLSDNEEEDLDERQQMFRPILEEKLPKLASLDKMISLILYLIEKIQTQKSHFILSKRDFDSLISNRNFHFIQQQIKDNINLRQTFQLVCILCHLDDNLFSPLIDMIFNSIIRFPENCSSFFRILSLITETNLISLYFSKLILPKIWELAEHTTSQTLEWLIQHVTRNKIIHEHVFKTIDNWVFHYLIENPNNKIRSSAAQLLISLVPSNENSFRQNYRPFRAFPYSLSKDINLTSEGVHIVDELFSFLLSFFKKIKNYADPQLHGTQRLTNYFYVLAYFLINTDKKWTLSSFYNDFWNLFQTKLSEPAIPIHQNKQAFFMFWYLACQEWKDSIKFIVQNQSVFKKIAFNYILVDHDDQDVILFNKNMLPYYYGLLKLCCESSHTFTRYLATHQNIQWAFKNITPYMNHYQLAVQELFKLMKFFVTVSEESTENDIQEISHFKRVTLRMYINTLEPNVHWGTLISVFNILVETPSDHIFVIQNNGLCLIFQSFNSLHLMFHQATACHITNELVDLLKLIHSLLTTFDKNSELLFEHRLVFKKYIETKKLLFLLNTYTPSQMREALLNVLLKLVIVFPEDHLLDIVQFLLFQHEIFKSQHFPFVNGPYFPKRGQKNFQTKSSLRPLRPTFQMCFNSSNLENHLVEDIEYEKLVYDFYKPYYIFVENICRYSLENDSVFDDLIDLSIRLAHESLYFHCKIFISFWLEVCKKTDSSGQKFLEHLILNQIFKDYINTLLIHDRSFILDEEVYEFLKFFLPKIALHVITPNFMKHILSLIDNICLKSKLHSESDQIQVIEILLVIKLIYFANNFENQNDIVERLCNNFKKIKACFSGIEFNEKNNQPSRKKMKTDFSPPPSNTVISSVHEPENNIENIISASENNIDNLLKNIEYLLNLMKSSNCKKNFNVSDCKICN